MADYRFRIVLSADDDGYTVRVPALPEVVSCGATEDEALLMAEDAIRLAIEYRLDANEPIPAEPAIREVTVTVPA